MRYLKWGRIGRGGTEEKVPTICFSKEMSVGVHQIKLRELLISLAEVVQIVVIKERLKAFGQIASQKLL